MLAAQIMAVAGARQRWWLDRYDHVVSFGMSVQDRGTGRVFYPGGHPAIAYRLHPADAPDLGAGFHPQGTAGIGRVVDRDLRLLGADRISVVDASVFPDSPRVNPQITLMALSVRLADRLAREDGT